MQQGSKVNRPARIIGAITQAECGNARTGASPASSGVTGLSVPAISFRQQAAAAAATNG